MPHHINPATIVVVGVRGVVCELLAYEGHLALLLASVCLVVSKLATIFALGEVVLSARSGMTTPPST